MSPRRRYGRKRCQRKQWHRNVIRPQINYGDFERSTIQVRLSVLEFLPSETQPHTGKWKARTKRPYDTYLKCKLKNFIQPKRLYQSSKVLLSHCTLSMISMQYCPMSRYILKIRCGLPRKNINPTTLLSAPEPLERHAKATALYRAVTSHQYCMQDLFTVSRPKPDHPVYIQILSRTPQRTLCSHYNKESVNNA